MTILEDLRSRAQADIEAVKLQQAALDDIGYVAGQLSAKGFLPEFDVEETERGPVIALRVRLRLGYDALPVPEPVRALPDFTVPEVVIAPSSPPAKLLARAKAKRKTKAKPAPKAKSALTNVKRWTEGEIERLIVMHLDGMRPEDIAAAFGCNRKAVTNCLYRRSAIIQARAAAMKGAQDVSAPAPPAPKLESAAPKPLKVEPATPADAPAPAPAGEKLGASDRYVMQRLAALGHAAPWTPEKDLKLVTHIVRGDGIGTAAAIVRVQKEVAVERWKQLLPEVTMETQAQLLRLLRGRFGNAF